MQAIRLMKCHAGVIADGPVFVHSSLAYHRIAYLIRTTRDGGVVIGVPAIGRICSLGAGGRRNCCGRIADAFGAGDARGLCCSVLTAAGNLPRTTPHCAAAVDACCNRRYDVGTARTCVTAAGILLISATRRRSAGSPRLWEGGGMA
jgi:hypothetical protein